MIVAGIYLLYVNYEVGNNLADVHSIQMVNIIQGSWSFTGTQ